MARSTEAIVEPSILGALDGRCKKQGCLLTVYFDDVTLSGETVPGEFIWNVRQLIHRAGPRYHKKSTMSVEITGVIVSG